MKENHRDGESGHGAGPGPRPRYVCKVIVALLCGCGVDDYRILMYTSLLQPMLALLQMLSLQLCRLVVAVTPVAALELGRRSAMSS